MAKTAAKGTTARSQTRPSEENGTHPDLPSGKDDAVPKAQNRSDLSVAERQEYVKAVLCLQKKPARPRKTRSREP